MCELTNQSRLGIQEEGFPETIYKNFYEKQQFILTVVQLCKYKYICYWFRVNELGINI